MKTDTITVTIYKVFIFGDRMADVTTSEGLIRIALDWGHLDPKDYVTLTPEGCKYLEARVKEETSADEIEYSR